MVDKEVGKDLGAHLPPCLAPNQELLLENFGEVGVPQTAVSILFNRFRPFDYGSQARQRLEQLIKKHRSLCDSAHDRLAAWSLCGRCEVVDLTALAAGEVPRHKVQLHDNFQTEVGQGNDCTLCKILRDCRLFPGKEHKPYNLELFMHAGVNSLVVVPAGTSNNDLQSEVSRKGLLFCRRATNTWPQFLRPQPISSGVNFDSVHRMIRICEHQHPECQDNTTGQIDGLRLIDCVAETVVKAPPNATYVALSYVWGTTANHALFTKTVQDAIVASKALGYRFLWVDKHCIDQGNPQEKHLQIRQMDLIYRHAHITIIAAAGHDATCGLPGVNKTPRQPSPTVDLGTFRFIRTPPFPQISIPSTTWASRGWTLQEAVLSRRRLFFTETEVYFECDEWNCCESLAPSFEPGQPEFRFCCPAPSWSESGLFSTKRFKLSTHGPKKSVLDPSLLWGQYRELVIVYSRRHLSYDSDVYDAFSGILRQLLGSGALREVGGIIYTGDHRTFLGSLLWYHEDGAQAEQRRPHGTFPSWSWIGWKGPIAYAPLLPSPRGNGASGTLFEPGHGCLFSTNVRSSILEPEDIFIEYSTGATASLCADRGTEKNMLSAKPVALWLRVNACAAIAYTSVPEGLGTRRVIGIRGCPIRWRLSKLRDMSEGRRLAWLWKRLNEGVVELLLLAVNQCEHRATQSCHFNLFFLVVEWQDDVSAFRLGLAIVEGYPGGSDNLPRVSKEVRVI